MIEELKPCPFCGGKAEYSKGFIVGGYSMKCSECGTEHGGVYKTEAEAIEAWNRRVRE